jgi:hypothetical protein
MSKNSELSRRDLFAAAAAAASLAVVTPLEAQASAVNDTSADLRKRRRKAKAVLDEAAEQALGGSLNHHPTNGDEEDLNGYIGNHSKGLQHNDFGEVDEGSYQSLLHALRSGKPEDFEKIILGTPASSILANAKIKYQALQANRAANEPVPFYRPHSERQYGEDKAGVRHALLVNPQAGLAFDLEGTDSHEFVMPPPPSFGSKEVIAEIAESYWMALTRNIPFDDYTDPKKNDLVLEAAKDLSEYEDFRGPKDKKTGKVTIDTLFRGRTEDDLVGPYVSQFMLRDVPFGAYKFPQKVAFSYPPNKGGKDPDFLIAAADWLAAQQGKDPQNNPRPIPQEQYIHRGRVLASYVHIDELFQAYFLAALTLGSDIGRGGLGAPHNEGNPYDGFVGYDQTKNVIRRQSTQQGFGTLGEPNFKGLVTEVGTRALKAVWYQKWFVHRRLRPEEFAGRIHFVQAGKKTLSNYPFHPEEFAKLKKKGSSDFPVGDL